MPKKPNVKSSIHAKDVEISVVTYLDNQDYISLTDIARYRDQDNPRYIIQNWMRLRSTIEFLGLWEELHNPKFKRVEFDTFKNEAGANSFVLTPQKWIKIYRRYRYYIKIGQIRWRDICSFGYCL